MEKNHQEHDGIFTIIRKEFFSIPFSIRIVSFSSFLFLLGWGLGADTFFSIYVEDIVHNVFRISVI